MPRNGSGVYSPVPGSAGVPVTPISSAEYNAEIADIGNEITNSLPTTGVKAMGANLPMGGNKIVNMADPTISTDGMTKNYADRNYSATNYNGGTTTGTANAQVLASVIPANFILTAGARIWFTPGFTNTSATTLAITTPAISATSILKQTGAGPVALTGGELIATVPRSVTYNGTQFVLDAFSAIGENILSNILVGAGATPANSTPANITSISLSPGIWSVSGNVWCLSGSGDTLSVISGWISTTSASSPTTPNNGAIMRLNNQGIPAASSGGSPVGTIIYNFSATTTVFLSGVYTISAGVAGCTLYGAINATRIG